MALCEIAIRTLKFHSSIYNTCTTARFKHYLSLKFKIPMIGYKRVPSAWEPDNEPPEPKGLGIVIMVVLKAQLTSVVSGNGWETMEFCNIELFTWYWNFFVV